jgi:uncharacterized C2H2 Zn-finger protein
MARTALDSLRKIASARVSLKDKADRLVEAERRVIEEVGRLLSGVGYSLVPTGDRAGDGKRPARRPTRVLPKTLKCPKCDRRFSLQMHVGRHLSAKHGSPPRGRKAARPAAKKRAR